MRVLIDECLPRQLRQWLLAAQPGWTVATVQGAGWASMKNGVLLRTANGSFDVLVTADKNMHLQQNFVGLDISVRVFPASRVRLVQAGVGAIAASVSRLRAGEKAIMELAPAAEWGSATLADVIPEGGITRHVFGF